MTASHPVLPSANPAARRLANLDAMRFVAAISIIWLHASDVPPHARFHLLSLFAVPFFAASAATLAVRKGLKPDGGSLVNYARGRVFRLYVPFFAWSAIYLVLRDAKHAIFHEPLLRPAPWMLISGAAGHLWFLPFIAVVTIAAFAYGRAARSRVWYLPLTVVAAAAVPLSWLTPCPVSPSQRGLGFLVSLSWAALPSAIAGVLVGQSIEDIQGFLARAKFLAWPLLLAASGLLFNQFAHGASVWQANAAGVLVLLAVLGPAEQLPIGWLAPLGELAYGIYLVHIAFLQLLEAILDYNNRSHVPWWQICLAFVLTVIASTLTAALLRRWRVTAWLIGAARVSRPAPLVRSGQEAAGS